MRMMDEGRAPGVQHRHDADLGAEMLRIGGDREQRVGDGLEQQVVDDGLVLIGEIAQLLGQREHDVEVVDRQELGLPSGLFTSCSVLVATWL
jgi:hypothetical protein